MRLLKKVFFKLHFLLIKNLDGINNALFTKKYTKLLRKQGMKINGRVDYISSSAYLDGTGLDLIELNKNVVISKGATLLTHDFSMRTCFLANGYDFDSVKDIHINKGIVLEENVFVGLGATILPGSVIHKNCIIGSGAVVKGEIEEDSIVIGNPARIIGKTSSQMHRYDDLFKKYYKEK